MSEPPSNGSVPDSRVSRAVHLLLTGVIAMAFVGFFVGLRQGKTLPDLSPQAMHFSVGDTGPLAKQKDQPAGVTQVGNQQAIPATAWRDFDRRVQGPNRRWQNSFANLKQPPIEPIAFVPATEADREELQAVRGQRRAFPGAPPTVPHPIDQMSTSSCNVCHGEGVFIGKGVRAPKMSHPLLANCTQCHVESIATDLPSAKAIENTFHQIGSQLSGNRAWPGAPPTIPHATWMRESCLSCHGPTGEAAIRTSHPARANCLQCHAPSAVMDQLVVQDAPGWLGSVDSQPKGDAP